MSWVRLGGTFSIPLCQTISGMKSTIEVTTSAQVDVKARVLVSERSMGGFVHVIAALQQALQIWTPQAAAYIHVHWVNPGV